MLHGNIFQIETLEQKTFFSSIDFALYVLKHPSLVLLHSRKTSEVPAKQLLLFMLFKLFKCKDVI